MKKLILLVILLLVGCNMTPEQAQGWQNMSQSLNEAAEGLDNKYYYHPDYYYRQSQRNRSLELEQEEYYRRLNQEAWERKYSRPVEVP